MKLLNSSEKILKPDDGLQVVWSEEKNSHILLQGERAVAAHHNGFTCRVLMERILSGDLAGARAQLEYIRDCGGEIFDSPFEDSIKDHESFD